MAKKTVASLNGKKITAVELKRFKAKQASEDKKFWNAEIKKMRTKISSEKKRLAEKRKLKNPTLRNIHVTAITNRIKELEQQIKRMQKI